MPSYTRRQLKEDKFAETAQGAMQWASGHRKGTLWTIVLSVAVVVTAVLLYTWHSRQTERANADLSKAIRTFNARLREPGTPAGEDLSFTSITERAQQAEKEFTAIADNYRFTKAGKLARYMAASAALQAGDKSGEEKMKAVADSGNSDVAPLAKLALASLYHATGRDSDAIKIYTDLMDHPKGSVSKAQAQLALADLLEPTDPKRAELIYQAVQKENPDTVVAQIAASKLGVKKQ